MDLHIEPLCLKLGLTLGLSLGPNLDLKLEYISVEFHSSIDVFDLVISFLADQASCVDKKIKWKKMYSR